MTDRRTDLLDAAIEEIAIAGTRGMRVEAVARRAGVSPALIYHHFGDRSTLLTAALERVGVRADTYTARSVSPRGSARDRLTALLVAEVQDDPEVRINSAAWGELRDTAIFDATLRPTIAALTEQWVHDLAVLVEEGLFSGDTDDERAANIKRLIEQGVIAPFEVPALDLVAPVEQPLDAPSLPRRVARQPEE